MSGSGRPVLCLSGGARGAALETEEIAMVKAWKSTGARAVAATLISTAGVLGVGIGPASAQPPSPTPVPGVNLQNMWMHCNAYGGDYYEGDGWAVCYLPSGQTVLCVPSGCTMSGLVIEPTPIVPRPPVAPVAAVAAVSR